MNPVRPYRYPLQAPLPYLGANVMVTFNERLNGFYERIGGAAPASGGGVGNWSLFTQQYDTTVKQWTIKQTGGDGAVFGIDSNDSHGQPHQQLLNWREPTKAVTVMYAMNYVNGGGDGAANAVFAKQASNGSKIAWGFNVNATTGFMTFQIWDGTTQQTTSTITPTASTWQVYVGRWQANAQFDITPWTLAGVKGTTTTGVNFNGKIAHDNSVGSFCYFTQHTAAWGGCWPRYMTNAEVSAVIHAAQSQGNSFWRPPSLLFPTFAVVVHGIDVGSAEFGAEVQSVGLVPNIVAQSAEFGPEVKSVALVLNMVVQTAEFGPEVTSAAVSENVGVQSAEFGTEVQSVAAIVNVAVLSAEFGAEVKSVALVPNIVVQSAEFGAEVTSAAVFESINVVSTEFGVEFTSSALTLSTNLGVVSAEFGTEVTSTSLIRVSSVGAVSAEFGNEMKSVSLSAVSDLAVQSAEFGYIFPADPWSGEFSSDFGPLYQPIVTVIFDIEIFGPEFGFETDIIGTTQMPRVFDNTQQPFDTGYRSLRVVPIKPHRDKTALLKAYPSLFLYLNPSLDRVVQVEPTTRVVSVIGTPLSSIAGAVVAVRIPQTTFALREIGTPEFGWKTDGVVAVSFQNTGFVGSAEFGFEAGSPTIFQNNVRLTSAQFGFEAKSATMTKQSALAVDTVEFGFDATSAAMAQNDVRSNSAEFGFEGGSPFIHLIHTISVDTPKFSFEASQTPITNIRSLIVTGAKFGFKTNGAMSTSVRAFSVDSPEFEWEGKSLALSQTHNVIVVPNEIGWKTFGATNISQNATVTTANPNLFLTTIMTASPWGLSGTTLVRDATDTADNRWRFDLTVGTGRSWIFNSQALTPGTVYTISGEVAGTVPFDVYSYDGGAFPYGNTLTKHIIPNNGTTTSTAIPTSQVLDFMGINTHIDFPNSPSTTTFSNSVNYLGFKHLRDSPNQTVDVGVSGTWQAVANATGAKFCSFLNEGSIASMQSGLPRTMSLATQGIIEFVEGGNEEDDPFAVNAGNSMTAARDFQPTVFASAHAALLPCVNMSLGSGFSASNSFHGDYDKVGDLSNVCDYANAHTYQNPGGQTTEFAMQFLDTLAHLAAPSRQVMTTEVGWNLANGFTQAQQQRYALFALFDAIKNRDARIYYYAIFDDTNVGGGSFGLMNTDGTPRLAATTLHNLNAILADTGTARPNRTLAYTLSGNTSNDHVVLMQKSTGTFQLAMWNEVDAAHNVTITLPGTATTVNVYDPQTGTTATSTSSNVSSKTVSIPDHVIIVEVVGLAGTIASQTFSFSFTKQATVAGGNPSVGIVYNYTGTQDFGTNTFSKMKLETGSQATVYVDPPLVPLNVSTSFSKGGNIVLNMSTFKSSGDIVNGIIPSGMPDLTFTVNVANQTITVGTVSATFTGTESGTFKLVDSFGNTSVQANFTVTVTTVVVNTSLIPQPIIAVWGYSYNNADSLATIQANHPEINSVSVGVAIGDTSRGLNGHVIMDGNTYTASDIAAWTGSGRIAILMLGGDQANASKTNAIVLLTTTAVTNCFNDCVAIIDRLGLQGITYDLESGSNQYTPSTLNDLSTRFKNHYGQNFIICADARDYELEPNGHFRNVYDAAPSLYDFFQVQFYGDPSSTGDATTINFMANYISDYNNSGFPLSKVILGCSDNNGDSGAAGGVPTYVTVYQNAINKYGLNALRGVIWWSTNPPSGYGAFPAPMANLTKLNFTASIGGTCTLTGHTFKTGVGAYRVSTSGTLPGGLSATQDYCPIVVDANTFRFATNKANAFAGTFVNITSAGNGTQTIKA